MLGVLTSLMLTIVSSLKLISDHLLPTKENADQVHNLVMYGTTRGNSYLEREWSFVWEVKSVVGTMPPGINLLLALEYLIWFHTYQQVLVQNFDILFIVLLDVSLYSYYWISQPNSFYRRLLFSPQQMVTSALTLDANPLVGLAPNLQWEDFENQQETNIWCCLIHNVRY
jgi:hypothetical protein